MVPPHRPGHLKQVNKRHKKARSSSVGISISSTPRSSKVLTKRERRLLSKQRRTIKVEELKKCVGLRGSKEQPLMCVVIPLTSSVPGYLAQLLLRKADPCAMLLEDPYANLQHVVYIQSPMLKKHYAIVTADCNDLFGCIDLAQLADWLVLLCPSDCSGFSPESNEFLTALYAQGLTNTSFAVMSSLCDVKGLKRDLQKRIPIPEDTIYRLNRTDHAIALLRHMSNSSAYSASLRANKMKGLPFTGFDHSAARYRAGLLADSLSVVTEQVTIPEEKTNVYLRITGCLRGAPIFLSEPLEQSRSDESGPLLYIPGWGEFPLAKASWTNDDGTTREWLSPILQGRSKGLCRKDTYPMKEYLESFDDDSDDPDKEESINGSQDLGELPEAKPHGDDDPVAEPKELDEYEDAEDMCFSDFAARTAESSQSSSLTASQLAKFREARMAELFPDEVETPSNLPARARFAKYRSLPRFHGSVWPIEKDIFPTHYENIACFRNYNRNRRSVLRYVRQRLAGVLAMEDPAYTNIKFIPSGIRPTLLLGPMDTNVLNMILKEHDRPPDAPDEMYVPPLVVWSLLPHENRISVSHFLMRRLTSDVLGEAETSVIGDVATKVIESGSWSSDSHTPMSLGEDADSQVVMNDEEIRNVLTGFRAQQARSRTASVHSLPLLAPSCEPVKSKELMLFQCGIRRFVSAPVYSTVTASPHEKAKFEKYFKPTSTGIIATTYGPVMYAPLNVLQFRVRVNEPAPGEMAKTYMSELVATGTLHSIDPSRLILKRIFLSGHPFRIHQRHVVARFMFFNPVDVDYFKSVPLMTKNGAVGHIKESLGTHGHMKCVFDRKLNAADVILMPLYKRVFPKWVYEPQIVKVFEPKCPGKLEKIDADWFEAAETLQLRKKPSERKSSDLMDDSSA
ncbi:unnamed protein product [Calicophoron daubneyi]|uniref:Pre-rRNA-processing protein TSR1 homolog n=1 Tax=Calicophoron daubneyi TaxID=300641 RepID=A0AAV2TPS1_CALDB